MNVGAIFRVRFAGCNRLVDGLRSLHRVGRLRHVGFWWMFLHSSKSCNKPAYSTLSMCERCN
jgi:hypothetical protein